MSKWIKWVGLMLGLLILFFIILVCYFHNLTFVSIDYDSPPKFIEADFIDLSKIYTISKYRSSEGHSTDDSVEKCRSLRHIFGSQGEGDEFTDMEDKWNKIHNRPSPEDSISIYAPVTGWVTDVFESSHLKDKQGIAGTIIIRPDNAQGFEVRIDSVFVDPGIHAFMRVKAGDKIGVICTLCPGEISIGYNSIFGRRAVSYVAALSDAVFAEYQKRGMKTREEAIISREYRDAHPFTCADPKNETSEILDNPEMKDMDLSYVVLSGYRYPSNKKLQPDKGEKAPPYKIK